MAALLLTLLAVLLMTHVYTNNPACPGMLLAPPVSDSCHTSGLLGGTRSALTMTNSTWRHSSRQAPPELRAGRVCRRGWVGGGGVRAGCWSPKKVRARCAACLVSSQPSAFQGHDPLVLLPVPCSPHESNA